MLTKPLLSAAAAAHKEPSPILEMGTFPLLCVSTSLDDETMNRRRRGPPLDEEEEKELTRMMVQLFRLFDDIRERKKEKEKRGSFIVQTAFRRRAKDACCFQSFLSFLLSGCGKGALLARWDAKHSLVSP